MITIAWEQRKLGEVALSFEYGLNVAAKEYDGVNKYLRITDIDDESHNFKNNELTPLILTLQTHIIFAFTKEIFCFRERSKCWENFYL